jgi:hypothetical protein
MSLAYTVALVFSTEARKFLLWPVIEEYQHPETVELG